MGAGYGDMEVVGTQGSFEGKQRLKLLRESIWGGRPWEKPAFREWGLERGRTRSGDTEIGNKWSERWEGEKDRRKAWLIEVKEQKHSQVWWEGSRKEKKLEMQRSQVWECWHD